MIRDNIKKLSGDIVAVMYALKTKQYINEAEEIFLKEELLPSEEREAEKMARNNYGQHQRVIDDLLKNHAAPDTESKFQYDSQTHKRVIRVPVSLQHDIGGEPHPVVAEALKNDGLHFTHDSYIKNKAFRTVKFAGNPEKGIPAGTKTQEISIGSHLDKKGNEKLKKTFENDPFRASKKTTDYDIVISNHPHDVYGMSTGRGWTSCSQMRKGEPGCGGPAAKKMQEEIDNGTHVAYLVPRGGNHDTEAVARIALKPHTALNAEEDRTANHLGFKQKHKTLVPEASVYGQAPADFKTKVSEITNQLFPKKADVYLKNQDVYDDSSDHFYNASGSPVTPEHMDAAFKIANKETKSHMYMDVDHTQKYKSTKLNNIAKAKAAVYAEPSGDFKKDINAISNTYDKLDDDQVNHGFRKADHAKLAEKASKIAKTFDPDNEEHLNSFGFLSSDHPFKSHLRQALRTVEPVKTAQEFMAAHKRISKVGVGSDAETAIKFSPEHQMGQDPVMHLSKAGALSSPSAVRSAINANRELTGQTRNLHDVLHSSVLENHPHAIQNAQLAAEALSSKATRNLAPVGSHKLHSVSRDYADMNPDTRHFFANMAGHGHEDVNDAVSSYHAKHNRPQNS